MDKGNSFLTGELLVVYQAGFHLNVIVNLIL